MTDTGLKTFRFEPLGNHVAPSLPTDASLKLAVQRVIDQVVKRQEDDPFIAEDQLQRAGVEKLDVIVAPPPCGPLLDDLSATFEEWVKKADARLLVLVMPPCDGDGVITAWARQRDLDLLEPPARDDLCATIDVPRLDGEGILVIPTLERWTLRHADGLGPVRSLLEAVAQSERRIMIGCNSWVWSYLSRAVDIDVRLLAPLTPCAFDGDRLRNWFSQLAKTEGSDIGTFRLSENGDDVFGTDEEGEAQSDFFERLAAQSLGIPWVAWHLWRRCFRNAREEQDNDDTPEREGDEDTVWISSLKDFFLPRGHEQPAMLVLHALLIHGPLSVDHLAITVPLVGDSTIIPALLNAGFVRMEGDAIACVPAAYPAIRRELENAGFPVGGV